MFLDSNDECEWCGKSNAQHNNRPCHSKQRIQGALSDIDSLVTKIEAYRKRIDDAVYALERGDADSALRTLLGTDSS